MKFSITTPIFYVNNVPHIGQAYAVLAADILARYHRISGDEVFFLTGTDEHGAKIAEAAAKAHLPVEQFTDNISAQFRQMWDNLGITYDRFIRTTEAEHIKSVAQFLERLHDSKFVYEGHYSGLYCRGCEEYKTPGQLVDGKCPIHLTVPESLSEPAYFFKLSAFQTELIKLITSGEMAIDPQIRRHEVLSFLEGQPLEDIAISRQNVAWGIPLPWDKDHTIYVWVDALINYYTALGEFWPPSLQIIGKDIIRFHCVIWPALLLAIGESLPKQFFAHGFFTINGQKMSKSLGNVVNPDALAKEFGSDALRFYLFRAFPYGADGDFSLDLFKEQYQSGLGNELGNLVQRVLTMTGKYTDWLVPAVNQRSSNIETAIVDEVWQQYDLAMQRGEIDQALKKVWDLVRFANQRIDQTKPWDLAKTNQDQLHEVLYELLEIIRHLSVLLIPVLPDTAQKIHQLLGVSLLAEHSQAQYNALKKWGGLKSGSRVSIGTVLFPRIEAD